MRPRRPTTVLRGDDSQALQRLFSVHAPLANDILDCTYNGGVMWRGVTPHAGWRQWRTDIDPTFNVHVAADFRALPFRADCMDVVVFDPPHAPPDARSPMLAGRYRAASAAVRSSDNICEVFDPFLREARHVLRPGGVVFAKVADLVHNHRYQWQQVEFIKAAQALGMAACDQLIKCDPRAGTLMGKWQNVYHMRKAHVYWIVIRNGPRCERR